MNRYFVDTGDGIEYCDTQGEAQEQSRLAFEYWERIAQQDGEWPEEVTMVCWGEIRRHVRGVRFGDSVKYTLQDTEVSNPQ